MNEAQVAFQAVVDALLDEGKTFPRHHLYQFSDIEPSQLETLLNIWPRLTPTRKQALLANLDDLAAEDTLLCFDDLGRSLLVDPDPQVRILAMNLLSECEDVKLVPAFLDILGHDEDAAVRAAAATTLGLFVELGELEEISVRTRRQVEDALLGLVNGDDRPVVRLRALESLGYSSRPEIPVLLESAYAREDPEWVASALFAMGRSIDDRWQEQVIHMLFSENQCVRVAAVQAAGELALASARPLLLSMLDGEEDDDVFSAAIWSLSQIGGEDVRTYLENLLDRVGDDDEQAGFIEAALENLAFTEDLNRFEMMAFDAEDKPSD